MALAFGTLQMHSNVVTIEIGLECWSASEAVGCRHCCPTIVVDSVRPAKIRIKILSMFIRKDLENKIFTSVTGSGHCVKSANDEFEASSCASRLICAVICGDILGGTCKETNEIRS